MFKQIFHILTDIGERSDIGERPDNLIANRYELKHLIGKGAMGKVYCAYDRNFDGVKVAIKFLSQTIANEKIRARFEQEAKISTLLGEQSRYIVKVKDFGLDNHNIPFYVMELLEGHSLDNLINKKTLSLRKVLSLTRQICLALECAHNGILVNGELSPIIHRDIKPSNIFLVQDPNLGDLVKIVDFGIAQIINPYQSGSLRFMGTPKYCSPEQLAEEKLDPRSDIYSLGVMMYVMLAKETPIKAKNNNFQGWYCAHHEFKPKPLPRYLNLPINLEKLIMCCLEKSPDNRPQNVGEILKVINSLEKQNSGKSRTININISPGREKNLKTKYKNTLSLQEIYHRSSWPGNKPQQKIVFPKLKKNDEGVFVSLWTMLEPEDIMKFNPSSTVVYNHFLFQGSPHPMLLWISLFYNPKYGPKWLPCYLDLKTKLGHQIVGSLIEQKLYHILLFAINQPEEYQQISKVQISQNKAKEIRKFLQKSTYWQGEKQPEASKKILKKQFEVVKGKILEIIKRVNSK